MRTKQLVAGAGIVGGVGLNLVGLAGMVVNADASPSFVSNEPDPSFPTFTIEPAPSAPSPDIASDTGIASSPDTGSGMPSAAEPELTVSGPSDLPPILAVPNGSPPIEGPDGTAGPPAANGPRGAPPNPPDGAGGPSADLGPPCRPLWCPRPPDPPSQPPSPLPDPFWLESSDPWESTTTVLPSPCVGLPQRPDAAPLPPLQYGGQTVSPAFDNGVRQWGLVFRKLGPAVRTRMPEAGSDRTGRIPHLSACSITHPPRNSHKSHVAQSNSSRLRPTAPTTRCWSAQRCSAAPSGRPTPGRGCAWLAEGCAYLVVVGGVGVGANDKPV
jgi:hypothetical protein